MDYLETHSITEFKSQHGNIKILSKTNGSYWFKAGSITGTVSSKLTISEISPETVSISLVEVDNSQFWLLHRTGGEAVMTL
jgi:hypothetical protein